MAAYGPRALELAGQRADGADPAAGRPLHNQVGSRGGPGCGRGGRAATPPHSKWCVAAPAYVGDDLDSQREQLRWFGGMVGNHVADIVERYGAEAGGVPEALTAYISGRKGYDYSHHGKPGNATTDFVPDEVVDRFCVLGPVATHMERMNELAAIGVDQFAIYLMHDQKEETLRAYSSDLLPAFAR